MTIRSAKSRGPFVGLASGSAGAANTGFQRWQNSAPSVNFRGDNSLTDDIVNGFDFTGQYLDDIALPGPNRDIAVGAQFPAAYLSAIGGLNGKRNVVRQQVQSLPLRLGVLLTGPQQKKDEEKKGALCREPAVVR